MGWVVVATAAAADAAAVAATWIFNFYIQWQSMEFISVSLIQGVIHLWLEFKR